MAGPVTYRPEPGSIPLLPGVYRFRDEHGGVLYVGKAKKLRQRLSSYFADPDTLHPRTRSMVLTARSVDWVTVGNEVEALQLEYSWIKEYDPRFNVRFRDDKSYPFLAVTVAEKYPRAMVMRGEKKKGTTYFGPYVQAWAIRETLDLVSGAFGVRTCSPGVFRRAELIDRPCLLGDIGKCSAPCVQRISEADYRQRVNRLVAFMSGKDQEILTNLTADMQQAAAELDYEKAARLRDTIGALTKVQERNVVVLEDDVDADFMAMSSDELLAVVEIFHVRHGRIRGQRSLTIDRPPEASDSEVLSTVVQQFYGERDAIPKRVFTHPALDDAASMSEWLSEQRGKKVTVRTPQRGPKVTLMGEVQRNADHNRQRHKLRRGQDITTRSQALKDIHEALELPTAPLRIECIDISHLAGEQSVGSLVVFEDGLPKKSDYRQFNIREYRDDTAAVYETVSRRFRRKSEGESTFRSTPDLLLIDGGQPQVSAAAQALADAEITTVPVAGIAKRLEEVWLPGHEDPVILHRSSEALYLIQRIRDEAHRFAITAHRKKRRHAATHSTLDEIPGVGEHRRKLLLKHFGSLKKLKQATTDQIAGVPGIGPRTAKVIYDALRAQTPVSAVNVTTGEVLEET